MTKEIWAAVIIAIVQIIVTVAVAWWQITNAKATMAPEQKQEVQSTNLLDKILKYFSKMPLHIIIPFFLFGIVASSIIDKHGFNFITSGYLLLGFIILLAQSLLWWILNAMQTFARVILNHEARLKCHDVRLFGLIDTPCKEDGKCKIDV